MKIARGLLLVFLLCLVMQPLLACAEEPSIHEVRIEARLNENGDAEMWEQWDVTVTSGTEWYLSMNGMVGMTVTGLSVTDETGVPYTALDNWDTSRNLEEKANTSGILRKGEDDYELCWGVGSYGRHQFTLTYTIAGLVKRYEDGVGFLHTFLSRGLSSPVERASVTITSPGHALNDTNTRIWAFGYDGDIRFADNAIIAENEKPLTTKQGIIIMAEFEDALFPGAQAASGSFEAIKNRAFEGSDYGQDDDDDAPGPVFWGIMGGIVALSVLGGVYAWLRFSLPDVYYRKKYGLSRAELKKTAQESTQIPVSGELPKIVYILSLFSEGPSAASLFNAYLLKWIREEAIAESMGEKKGKPTVSILFKHPPYGAGALEEQLYDMLVSASDQGELTEKGIEKWAYKKHSKIEAWYKEYEKQAAEGLRTEGILIQVREKRGVVSANIEVLDDTGWTYAAEVYGFKKYLIRCSNENSTIDDELWYEYLAYAGLFNISKQVETWYENGPMMSYPYGYYYLSRSFRHSFEAGTNRAGGSGGSASGGGGGGASGGGGGGSR